MNSRVHAAICATRGSSKQAANGVLDAAGSKAGRARLWPLYVPPEYEPWRAIDRDRYRQRLPNLFDPDQAAP